MLSNFVNTKFLYFENTTRIAKLALALASSFVWVENNAIFHFLRRKLTGSLNLIDLLISS